MKNEKNLFLRWLFDISIAHCIPFRFIQQFFYETWIHDSSIFATRKQKLRRYCLSTVIPCYEKDPIVRSRPLLLHFEGGRGRGEKQKLTKDSSRRSYGRVSRGLSRISGETTMERNGRVWCLRVRPTWWQECTRISASALIIKPPLVFDGH